MAPSSGHLLVPKLMRVFKFAVSETTTFIRSKVPQPSTSSAESLQPIPIHATRQPIHPLAFLRQSRSSGQARWFSSAIRNLTSGNATYRPIRSSLPKSTISKTIARQGGAPFSSFLRPNLTGGALPRSTGGYTLGGIGRNNVRHFSHTPASQAQVIQNVSTAIRAFWLSGQKARFDGVDNKTGEKRWKTVSQAQDQACSTMRKACLSKASKGSTLEFRLSPTITALGTFGPSTPVLQEGLSTQTLNASGLLDGLAADFARTLQDLATLLNELKRLSTLGDLPLSVSASSPTDVSSACKILKVHFPGCDGQTVENICIELGVKRGIVKEDEEWTGARDAEMALLFPFAESRPTSSVDRKEYEDGDEDDAVTNYFDDVYLQTSFSQREALDWRSMLLPLESPVRSPGYSTRSLTSKDDFSSLKESNTLTFDNVWAEEEDASVEGSRLSRSRTSLRPTAATGASEYEGVEGIYKFLAECDSAGATVVETGRRWG